MMCMALVGMPLMERVEPTSVLQHHVLPDLLSDIVWQSKVANASSHEQLLMTACGVWRMPAA
jgi:hypothetical protein